MFFFTGKVLVMFGHVRLVISSIHCNKLQERLPLNILSKVVFFLGGEDKFIIHFCFLNGEAVKKYLHAENDILCIKGDIGLFQEYF